MYIKKLNATGDTIVEVLIVLAVLSFAFTISSATANKGLNQSRNSQEHSQALGILNSQMELVRRAISQQTALPTDGTAFCMKSDATFSATLSDCNSGTSVTYSPTISFVASGTDSGYYQFKVNWPGAADLGAQQEVMNYRVRPLTATVNSGIPLSTTLAKMTVTVKAIPPNADTTTPPCTAAATAALSTNVTINLTEVGVAGTKAQTTSGGVTEFIGLKDNHTYNTLINTATLPSRYELCTTQTPAQSANKTVGPSHDGNPAISYTIRPICYTVPDLTAAYEHFETTPSHDWLGYYKDYAAEESDHFYTINELYYTHDGGTDQFYHGGSFDGAATFDSGSLHYVYRGDVSYRDSKHKSAEYNNTWGYFYEVWTIHPKQIGNNKYKDAITGDYDHYGPWYYKSKGSYGDPYDRKVCPTP